MTEQILRVTATDSARALITTLREKHGDLMFHQSGGCCDGSAPMCYPKGEFIIGDYDRLWVTSVTCQRRLNSDPPFADFVGVNLTHPASWLFQLLQDVTVVVLPRTWPALRLSFSRKLSPLIWTT